MIAAVSTGIRGALVTTSTAEGSAVRALVTSGTAASRVYLNQAPASAALPYIVMTYVAGGSTNETPVDGLDVRYQVEAISDDAAEAADLETKIRAALHNQTDDISLGGGWKIVDIQHEEPFFFVENVDKRQYIHAGGTYRVRANK